MNYVSNIQIQVIFKQIAIERAFSFSADMKTLALKYSKMEKNTQ